MSSIIENITNFSAIWAKLMKVFREQSVLTFQFDVSKLQKHLWSVIPIHLDQSASFGPLPINAYVIASRNVSFNS